MKFNPDSMTFAGNWKMNGRLDDTVNIEKLIKLISDDDANIILFPPFTLISSFVNTSKNSNLNIGGQDCHHEDSGAFTGSISASIFIIAFTWVSIKGDLRKLANELLEDNENNQDN